MGHLCWLSWLRRGRCRVLRVSPERAKTRDRDTAVKQGSGCLPGIALVLSNTTGEVVAVFRDRPGRRGRPHHRSWGCLNGGAAPLHAMHVPATTPMEAVAPKDCSRKWPWWQRAGSAAFGSRMHRENILSSYPLLGQRACEAEQIMPAREEVRTLPWARKKVHCSKATDPSRPRADGREHRFAAPFPGFPLFLLFRVFRPDSLFESISLQDRSVHFYGEAVPASGDTAHRSGDGGHLSGGRVRLSGGSVRLSGDGGRETDTGSPR